MFTEQKVTAGHTFLRRRCVIFYESATNLPENEKKTGPADRLAVPACRLRTSRGALPLRRICPCIRHRPLLLTQSLHGGVVRERLDEGLHAAGLPNRHTAAGAGIPTACPDPRLLGGADTAPECRHPGRPRAILQLQRLRRTAHSVYRPAAHPRTGPVHPLLQKAGAGRRPAGHLGSATARNILHLPGGGGKVPAYSARPAQRAVRRPGDAPPARRGEKLLGQPPKCGQGTLPAAQFHFRTAGR